VPPPLGPTTVTTLEQGYYCVFDHYYSGSQLDDRTLLVAAFAAFTKELRVLGLDQPNATMPALTGSRDKDWDAFAAVYSAVVNRLPADPALRQEVASATMQGMIGSLDDDHTRWDREAPNGGPFGLVLSDLSGDDRATPLVRDPLFVTSMLPGSPATAAGILPGDEIAAVNGVPPFVNGQLSQGVLDWLHAPKAPVKVTLHRPKDDTTFTVTLDPAGPRQPPPGGGSGSQPPPQQPGVTSRLLPGGLAYVLMPDFGSGRADQVLAAIAALRAKTDLKGVVLDLRGNTGGDPAEDARLLGAWAHDTTWSYFCDVHGHCDPQRTDDSVPLLHLPLVALTDGNCASGCDAFAATVKDRHLGTLVGTRTAGVIAGPGTSYLLDDNSVLGLTQQRALMADKEIQSGIGTVPDHQAPLTAAALSAGRDPGVDKAVSLLTGGS
jgi:carboxyl-terminal processing protease